MSRPIISTRQLSKRFGSTEALQDVSFDVWPGEIFALLGPSGCGKSTLLRIISGFETPSSGELLLDGKDMTQLAPNKRPINMVFQSYAVFPHMSVYDNVAYGLKMEKLPTREISERVTQALEQVHLTSLADRKPDQLSGGQQQRVALARALIKQPRVLLLDEPLSALDAKLRDAMRLELVKLQKSVGITFIIVTHDQSEAMAMADRIAVLESGRLRQIATPAVLYQQPVDEFVADFIGRINTFRVTAVNHHDDVVTLNSDALGTTLWTGPLPAVDSPLVLAVRPEHIQLSLNRPDNDHIAVSGMLGDVAFQGQHSLAELQLQTGQSLTAHIPKPLPQNQPIWAHWPPHHQLLLPTTPHPGRTTITN